MTRFLTAAAAALMLSGTSAAADVLYECDITQRKKDVDWISPKVAFIMRDDGTAEVIDGIILAFVDGVQRANLRRRGDRLIFNWSLSGLVDSAEQFVPKFAYRATLNTKDNTVVVRAKPASFPQQFSGKGSCKVRKPRK